MKTQTLEKYLSQLERCLINISASQRAEIILEIKSHVMDATTDNTRTVEEVLKSLGTPETVANRYLVERGLNPLKPRKRDLLIPIAKWCAIGGIGMAAIFTAGVLIVSAKFSPIISIDGENERLKILGGFVEVDGKKERLKIGGQVIDTNESSQEYKGSRELIQDKTSKLFLRFTNGNLVLNTSTDHKFTWDCKSSQKQSDPTSWSEPSPGDYRFDVSNSAGIKCNLSIPKQTRLELEGVNGKLQLDKPLFHIKAILTNGNIHLVPEETSLYRYETTATNGKIQLPKSSDSKDAYVISLNLVNGKVSSSKAE